ncbi:Thiosulfate sulfurtransferase GlpE [compost metagenome]
MKLLVLGLLLIGLVSCQTPPTKVTEQDAALVESGKNIASLMKEKPVILDARSSFDFNLNHVPGAINVRWEDFSQQDARARGVLERDLFAVARRLSLVGIDPTTPVLVLGKGSLGGGEEGRVAWTLKVLGIENVTTANINTLRGQNPREEPLVQNKPYWMPQVDESLWVDMKVFKDLVRNKLIPRSLPSRAKGATAKATTAAGKTIMGLPVEELMPRVVVLDVRGVQEFYIENLTQKKDVSVSVSQVDWTEFFNASGMPNKAILAKLEEKGITKDSYIFVISKHGVRSGAVTYALRELGWEHVTNVAGGYEQWNVTK